MNFVAHTLLTLILISFMHVTGTNVFLAIAFGVLLDIDHIFKIPGYIRKNGFKYVHNYPFRSFVQEPVLFAILIPFCFVFDNFIPLIFFSSHLFLDYLMDYDKRPFGFLSEYTVKGFVKSFSRAEFAITAGLLIMFLFVR